MAATIKIKNSSTTGAVPTSSDLVQGELAVNVTDLGLYTENASGTVVKLNAPSIDDKGTGATKRLTIDTSGNLGLGVTPSAWQSGAKAIQFGARGAVSNNSAGTYSNFINNAYFDGTNWRYLASDSATVFQAYNSGFIWNYAASGTAGNTITFTQAMTLDASGKLGIGATSPAQKLDVAGAIAVTASSGVVNPSYGVFGLYTGGLIPSTYIQMPSGGSIDFWKPDTGTAARIDSSGNLLVGTTGTVSSTTPGLRLFGNPNTTACALSCGPTTTATTMFVFVNGNGTVGYIQTSGSSTTYATSSDYRLKENIQPMQNALGVVAQLNPVTYNWKADGSEGQGFIAHELQAVVPDAVVGEKDAVDEEGNPKYQGIDTSFLVATLTAAIQELKATVDAQAARITALEQA